MTPIINAYMYNILIHTYNWQIPSRPFYASLTENTLKILAFLMFRLGFSDEFKKHWIDPRWHYYQHKLLILQHMSDVERCYRTWSCHCPVCPKRRRRFWVKPWLLDCKASLWPIWAEIRLRRVRQNTVLFMWSAGYIVVNS